MTSAATTIESSDFDLAWPGHGPKPAEAKRRQQGMFTEQSAYCQESALQSPSSLQLEEPSSVALEAELAESLVAILSKHGESDLMAQYRAQLRAIADSAWIRELDAGEGLVRARLALLDAAAHYRTWLELARMTTPDFPIRIIPRRLLGHVTEEVQPSEENYDTAELVRRFLE